VVVEVAVDGKQHQYSSACRRRSALEAAVAVAMLGRRRSTVRSEVVKVAVERWCIGQSREALEQWVVDASSSYGISRDNSKATGVF